MFTDATRAMAVGSGEKDNKKALAQRKKQVKTIHTYRYKICVFENTQNRLHVYHSNIASVNSFNSLRKMKFLHHHIYCFIMAIIFRCWMKNVRIARLGKLRTIHCLIGKTTTAWSVINSIEL